MPNAEKAHLHQVPMTFRHLYFVIPMLLSADSKTTHSSQAQDAAAGILASLLEWGFKRTHGLICLLWEMAAGPRPRSLVEWSFCPSLEARNVMTLYRLMLKLAGVVRRVNLGEREPCFQHLPLGDCLT